MGFSCTSFTTIVFCLTSMVVQSSGELIVLRHPLDDWDDSRRLLTCYSEDDDSALVWNLNVYSDWFDEENNFAGDFHPVKSGPKSKTECAIWNSTKCVANWEKTLSWELVNSVKKPTGPVLDYRWEGFEEIVFRETRGGLIYLKLGEMEEYSGNVVFSVRASREFDVFLCTKRDPVADRCFRINIGSSESQHSQISSCNGGFRHFAGSSTNLNCTDTADDWHGTKVVDEYEWRTFRIEWKSEDQTIKLFNETEVDAFLQLTVKQWHSVSHISIQSQKPSRVRFHFYDYHLIQGKDTELSTELFIPQSQNFCVKLLVGLCPNCQLEVSLLDEDGKHIAGNNTSGNENSADSEPLFWKPIYLIANLKNPMPKSVRLKIGAILDDDKDNGRWAVDSFRTCGSPSNLRKSTILTTSQDLYSLNLKWPEVTCQKLSYSKGAVVDSLSTSTIDDDTSKLLMLVRDSVMLNSSKSLGERWSICNPTGCACDRGYTGKNCETRCTSGFYGYNCNEQCESCASVFCDGADGQCASGCQKDVQLPPFCREVEEPIVEDITDTTARILQKVNPESLEYISEFQCIITDGDGRNSTINTTSLEETTFTINIQKLYPGRQYSVNTLISTNVSGKVTKAPSPEIIFVTSPQRCFRVETTNSSIIVILHQDLKGCELTGPYYAEIRRMGTGAYNTSFDFSNFPLNGTELEPHTEYKLTVYRNGGRVIVWTSKVRTLQSAPGKVRHIRTSHISDTNVTLHWTVPLQVNGFIAKYTVSIKRIKLLACEDLGQQTPVQDDITAEVNSTTASFSGLNPYAIYTASVTAHTTEPGMKKSIEFQTPERDIPTSSVRNLELTDNQTRLRWDKPNDCLKITGSTKFTKLVLTRLSDSRENWSMVKNTSNDHFDLSKLHLAHYTSYNVRVYVLRKNTGDVNHTPYGEKNWTTAPSAPSAVKSIDFYDADPDTNSISIRWVPPHPANGKIESYHLKFGNEGPSKELSISASEGKEACKPWENYVCIKNLPLQANATNIISVEIHARNMGVEAAGNSSFFHLNSSSVYSKAPGKPSNLTATNEGHGNVRFAWMHPLLSETKITRFEITIAILHSDLLEKLGTGYPVTLNYTITKYQEYYTKMVTLHPSTKYNVLVVAVNGRDKKSGAITTKILVPTSIGFANEKKPEVTFDGTLLDVIIPKIVNTTLNTTIKVIVKGLSTCTPNHPQESSPSVNQAKSVTEWDAAVYPVGNGTPESMKIYTEQNHGVTSICSLDLEGAYTIVFNVTDWYSGFSISTTTSPIAEKSSLAWLAILPVVLAVCMLVVFLWYRNRKTLPKQLREHSYVEPIPASLTTTTTVPTLPPTYQTTQVLKPSIPRRPSYLEIISPSSTTTLTNDSITLDTLKISFHPQSTENRSSDHVYTLPNEPDSCSVSIEDFDKYAKNAASSKLLYLQFKRLQVGLTSPCEYGKSPENIPKNRSLNLIAYDGTRVILEKIPGDPYSDYINATYIEGYKKERAYIAAQGPTSNTVNDFWRMVWEQKVRVMCMLTNVTEGTETKCEKYWPDVGARTKHGDFLISNIDEQVFADYTFRTFELNSGREMRKVTHLHFTGWPSLGVPKNHQSLVAYLRKLEQTPTGNGPILVHCSTGDDRTGTVILCDICLRQAVAEKAMDVMAVASRMRDSRANMVGTVQQYVLTHIIITESSVSWPTQIPCTEVLSSRMYQLRIRLPFDIQRLKDSAWQQQALRASAMAGPPISEYLTDGSPEEIYDDVFEEERNQIHAVSVDGVRANKQNWACWLPPPLTIPDFWEFVAERNIKLIIILQCSDPGNPSCYDIIPDKSIVLPTLQIEMKNRTSLDNGKYLTRDELLLFNTSQGNDRSQTVTVLTCRGWECGMVQKPPDPPALISLWKASERIPRKEGQTLVLCHDSITGCGLYLALSFLLERMTVERECDVIAAVRAVRRSKPEYVQSMEQFEYLYDAAVNYVESFQAYANFC